MGIDIQYPEKHENFLERCHAAGQLKPTPLLLQYETGDYNCLHQDLYGEHVFPLQVAILLSEPGSDFEGGEFVMTEQRPRMQSRAEVVPLRPRRRCRVRGTSSSCRGYAWGLSSESTAWRQPHPLGASSYRRNYFSRCRVRSNFGLSKEPLGAGAALLRQFAVPVETALLSRPCRGDAPARRFGT